LIWIDEQETAAPEPDKKSTAYIGPKPARAIPPGGTGRHGLATRADYNARAKIKAAGETL
jgi:hypothetical protein